MPDPKDPPDELPRDTVAMDAAAVPTIQMDTGKPASTPSQMWSGEHANTAFGRFEVLDIIGAGGMGVVLSAHDPQLDRKVAIKVLRTRGMTGERRDKEAARLLREARSLGQLSHPNVVTVYEAGTIDDRVYIAMELIEGMTLRAWQVSHTKAEVLDAYIKAGRGLAAGHAAGLVHRDFKPDNVLIGNDGRERVIDFGLAQPGRLASETDTVDVPSSSARITYETTTSFGTPVYMAPEQHSRDRTDARADQFAFCVSLYEGLFGRLPFAGATYGELVVNVTAGNVIAPPAGVVPAPAVAAIRRGLSLDPAARFPTMDALLDALAPRQRRRTGRTLAAIGGAALVAVAGTLAVVKLTGGPPPDPCTSGRERLAGAWDDAVKGKVKAAFTSTTRSHAAATFDRVAAGLDAYATDWAARRREVCEATQVRHERSDAALDLGMSCLDARLDELRALTALLGTADADVVDHAVAAIEDLSPPAACTTITATGVPLPASPEARAAIAKLQPEIAAVAELTELEKSTRAIEAAKPLLPRATALDYPPLAAELQLELGTAFKQAGKGADAELALHEATRLAALAKDDLIAAKAWTTLVAVVGFQQGRLDEALELAKVADVAIQRADADKAVTADLAYNVATAYYQKGDFDKARASFERALKLRIERYGENYGLVAKTINSIGGCQLRLDDIAGARTTFERALAIDDKVYGPLHPESALPLSNLGAVAQKQGDLDAAAKFFERALAIQIEVNGENNANVALTLSNLGSITFIRLDFAKANDYLTRSIAILDKLDPDNPRVALPLTVRAQARDGLKDFPAALADAERSVAILEKGTTDPSMLADARFGLADILWDSNGDHKRAIALATEAQNVYAATPDAKAKLFAANMWLAGHK